MTALLLSACGSSGNSGGSAKKTPVTGFFGASASATCKATPVIYSGLVRSDPAGSTKTEPSLAQRWTISPDGRTTPSTCGPA